MNLKSLLVFEARSATHDEGELWKDSKHLCPTGGRQEKAGQIRLPTAISKTGVKILAETIAEEVRDYNINVNCIMPSTMRTEENLRDFPGADTSKWVDTEDVAKVILFLVSEPSKVTSGATIPVFGNNQG